MSKLGEVLIAIDRARMDNGCSSGPFAVFLPKGWEEFLDKDYVNVLGETIQGVTLRRRLLAINKVIRVEVEGSLSEVKVEKVRAKKKEA